MIVKLRRRSPKYPDLSVGQAYRVIGIECDDFRIINDKGRPFLFPAALFKVTDADEPEDWISEVGEDGERYAYPASLNRSGFFEDFFDGKPEAVATFWRVVNEQLTAMA
jgi:hypothetical protein